MVGVAAGGQRIYRRFQIGHRGDQLGILCCRTGKADDSDAAAGADLAVLCAVSGLVNNVDKCFCAVFKICQCTSRHTP